MSGDSTAMRPFRLSPRAAAEACSMGYGRFITLVNSEDLFTIIPRSGTKRGKGRRYYLLTDEVEVYATQGEDALREFRIRKGRLKKLAVTKKGGKR